MTKKDTSELKRLLVGKYGPPEWFVTFEVPAYEHISDNLSESGKTRQIDALAVSRVGSRGNEVHAIEVKSDRSDWLAERANPSKADGWVRRADRFYVCAGKGVANASELPPGWGLYEPNGSGLREVVAASLNPWREKGTQDPLSRDLWVLLLRRAIDDRTGIGPLLEAEYAKGRKAAAVAASEDLRRELRDKEWRLKEVTESVQEFEKASGLKIHHWSAGDIGMAVQAVLEHRDLLNYYGNSERNIRRNLDNLREALVKAGWKPEEEPPA